MRSPRMLALLCALCIAASAFAQTQTVVVVGSNTYSAFSIDLTNGMWVYVDADPAAGTPVRATQRCLGYREVDYKSTVPGTLFFSAVAPTTNGAVISYDYSAQANKTNLVGFWVSKDVPMIVGPDGLAYITDGHHTAAGYLAPLSPVREIIPGRRRIILGHIVANYFDAGNPHAPDDAWWTARAGENNALLYGPDGDQLVLSGETGYGNLQPILPSVVAMPTTPSVLTTNGAVAMTPSKYRGLAWGLADAVVQSATDSGGKKIAGFKKTAPGSSVDINFVEFFWADYLRHRIVWDDTLSGSPLGGTNGDASATAAPLSFFTAVANGIALARSEVYRDEHGRRIFDYTNAATFSPNAVNWANGSISNGLAVATDAYNLYLRDDSTIAGIIQPSALGTNILHIDTVAGLTVTQEMQNIRTAMVNAGGRLQISWKDATVSNTVLSLPAGTGTVRVTGTNFAAATTILGGGALAVEGLLRGNVQVTNGVLTGYGTVAGALAVPAGTLAPDGALAVNGSVTLGGAAVMKAKKTGAIFSNDLVNGISALTYGGLLSLTLTGDAPAAGDAVKLFDATNYSGAFASFIMPALDSGLSWDTSRLIAEGTIRVATGVTAPTLAAQPASQAINVGTTVTLSGGAVGSLPISYQWQFNGADLPGQATLTLVLPNIQKTNQGQYILIATNFAGAVTSAPVTLSVNQLPIAGNDSLSTKQNRAVSVSTANLLANDTDADGDALAVTSVSPSTNGAAVALGANTVTYLPRTNFLGQDRFTYRVGDGHGGSAQGTVVVSVTSSNLPPLNHVTLTLTSDGRTIRFAGTPSRKYLIEKASEVTGPWSNLSSNITAAPDGFVEFRDTDSPVSEVRFYRSVTAP